MVIIVIMTEKYNAAVEGKSIRRRSRISIGKLKSPDRATLGIVQTSLRETQSFSSIQHMRRASFNVTSSTGDVYQAALLAANPAACVQKGSEPCEELKKGKNKRRQSELLPPKRLFLPEPTRPISPTLNLEVVLNLHTISSVELDDESDDSPRQYHPIHLRSRTMHSPASPTNPTILRSPKLSPKANYWSETAQVMSATGKAKLTRMKWSKRAKQIL